jgi:6-phosphogluconolactonase (cycloisomerase 2 family)
VTVYAGGANHNAKPIQQISGSYTQLDEPTGVAVDASGNIYVANFGGGSSGEGTITVYAAGSTGNVAPTAVISGSYTELYEPVGIALDPVNGDIYVANYFGPDSDGSVTFYAPAANGNVAPLGDINGSYTMLDTYKPNGIALDSSGNIYVSSSTGVSILVFAANSTGNVPPSSLISGYNTGLDEPEGLTLDSSAHIYVANEGNNTLTVYAAGSNGNASPIRTISGKKTKLSEPDGIALDANNNVYAANYGTNWITAYPAGASGNKKPIIKLKGKKTGLDGPEGIAIR